MDVEGFYIKTDKYRGGGEIDKQIKPLELHNLSRFYTYDEQIKSEMLL